MHPRSVTAVVLCLGLLSSACKEKTLSQGRAQAALTQWVSSNGDVRVIGVQTVNRGQALADIELCFSRPTGLSVAPNRVYRGPGQAEFVRYDNGTWVLQNIRTQDLLYGGVSDIHLTVPNDQVSPKPALDNCPTDPASPPDAQRDTLRSELTRAFSGDLEGLRPWIPVHTQLIAKIVSADEAIATLRSDPGLLGRIRDLVSSGSITMYDDALHSVKLENQHLEMSLSRLAHWQIGSIIPK